ncbi:STAS domain-containing protein [Amycolatopsis magusensis]|uniref:STAS domain-containing protein n=1 Tax=Amycolatopsis magusensis TaxID=882444 RepID=UPI0037A44EC4
MTQDAATVRNFLFAILAEGGPRLAGEWLSLQQRHADVTTGEDLRDEAETVLAALADGLRTELSPEEVVSGHPPLRDALVDLSLRRARGGATPTATAMSTLALKEALLAAVMRQSADTQVHYDAAVLLNRLLDAAGVLTFSTYVQGREEIIRAQHDQMLELSTPVLRLWRHVVGVPLIGTLDTTRTQVVMNGLLEAIQAQEARVAIIDITGVPTVDTAVAQHLLQTADAVRLMGAECLLSGIRPPIAQTITRLGIDLSAITTRATLAGALADAIRLLEPPGSGPPRQVGARSHATG